MDRRRFCLSSGWWAAGAALSAPFTASGQPQAAPQTASTMTATSDPTDTDPYLWLEDVQGPRALAWVRERNAQSEALLQLREGGWSLVVPDQQLAVEHHPIGQCLRLSKHIGKSIVEQLLTP